MKHRKFSMTEVLRQSVGVRHADDRTGEDLCRALVRNTAAAGALDACAYAFQWLAFSGRVPDCMPKTAREAATLIAGWASELGHASISDFADRIRWWNDERRSCVGANVSRAGEEPAPRSE